MGSVRQSRPIANRPTASRKVRRAPPDAQPIGPDRIDGSSLGDAAGAQCFHNVTCFTNGGCVQRMWILRNFPLR